MADSDDDPTEDWDEIHGFASPGEFARFERWVAAAIDESLLVAVDVQDPYSGLPMLNERWYRTPSGSVWRLVAPDPPFRGVFERVR